jgi:hypothetical protein
LPAQIEFTVSIQGAEVFDELYEELEGIPAVAATSIRADLYSGAANKLVRQAFEEALINAGPEFPLVYAAHLQQSLPLIRPFIEAEGPDLLISFTDPSEFGDYRDLSEGAHYQAISSEGAFSVSNPIKVGLPGPNQPIYNIDRADRRQLYWEAIVRGDTTFQVDFGGRGTPSHSKNMPIPAGAYNETLIVRTLYWGGRYPEWIILENGSESDPYSSPGQFSVMLEQIVAPWAEAQYTLYCEQLAAEIEQGGFMAKGGAFRNLAGEFAPLPYRNIA